jgi:three-Cys-motif partner protein
VEQAFQACAKRALQNWASAPEVAALHRVPIWLTDYQETDKLLPGDSERGIIWGGSRGEQKANMPPPFAEFDEIGYWSEIKLDIVRDYASAYSRILNSKKLPHIYVDAFAGAGQHISRGTGEFVQGSPLNALNIQPPFREYHFIDLNAAKIEHLQSLVGSRSDVHVYEGDCNEVLIRKIFPTLEFESFRRALCLLDPYGLDLNWDVMFRAGQLGTVDLFLNFPVMDMNRNALWRNPEKVLPEQARRMTRFWGDESWRQIAYSTTGNLFGEPEKESNETIAEAFRQRLVKVAGFKRVPEPLPMRNSRAIVYYLFFASQVGVAENIVNDIFTKHRGRGRNQ